MRAPPGNDWKTCANPADKSGGSDVQASVKAEQYASTAEQ
jgi:hypothetical protein